MPLEKFFQTQTSARPLGVARAAVGVAALIRAAIQYEILRSLIVGDAIRAPRFSWLPYVTLDFLWLFMGLWVLASISFALGFRTRLSGSVLLACLAYQLALDENLYANNFYLMALIVLLLTVADSGCSFSLDRRLFRKDPEQVSRWSTLLPRLQISIVYFYSAVVKLNPAFLAGRAIVRSTRLSGMLQGTLAPQGIAAITIGVEFFLALALWVPPLRRAAFALGFLLHAAIFVGMNSTYTVAMFTFGLTMLAPYLLFLEQPPGSRLVIWDDCCSFCGAWISALRRLDWLRIHRFEGSSSVDALGRAHVSREEADTELKLSFDGRTLGGFDAVREVLCLLPLSFLWAPLLSVPPLPSIGRRLYRRVAERRKCTFALAVRKQTVH